MNFVIIILANPWCDNFMILLSTLAQLAEVTDTLTKNSFYIPKKIKMKCASIWRWTTVYLKGKKCKKLTSSSSVIKVVCAFPTVQIIPGIVLLAIKIYLRICLIMQSV